MKGRSVEEKASKHPAGIEIRNVKMFHSYRYKWQNTKYMSGLIKILVRVLQRDRTNRRSRTHTRTHTHTHRFILRNWLMQLWGLISLKSVPQASRLEVQVRVDVAVLSSKSAGWKLRWGIYVAVFFFKINFYWSTVDLQCCVSFYCTAKCTSYTYAYIHSFLDYVPKQVITEY